MRSQPQTSRTDTEKGAERAQRGEAATDKRHETTKDTEDKGYPLMTRMNEPVA